MPTAFRFRSRRWICEFRKFQEKSKDNRKEEEDRIPAGWPGCCPLRVKGIWEKSFFALRKETPDMNGSSHSLVVMDNERKRKI